MRICQLVLPIHWIHKYGVPIQDFGPFQALKTIGGFLGFPDIADRNQDVVELAVGAIMSRKRELVPAFHQVTARFPHAENHGPTAQISPRSRGGTMPSPKTSCCDAFHSAASSIASRRRTAGSPQRRSEPSQERAIPGSQFSRVRFRAGSQCGASGASLHIGPALIRN
jgi:hypothetical protein